MIHGVRCRHLGHSLPCFLGDNGNHPEGPSAASCYILSNSAAKSPRSSGHNQQTIYRHYTSTTFVSGRFLDGRMGGCVVFANFPANPKAIKDVAVGQGSSGTLATVESWE